MQNTIKIDVVTDTIVSISTVDNGSNSIVIKFTNCTVNDTPPEVEFYKPEKYCGCVTFDTGQREYAATVPDECINDGHVFHFRYVCKDKAHKYFHVLGNATKFENMTLEKVANDVVVMRGNTLPETEITYLGLLLKLLTKENLDPTDKNCYEAGLTLYQSLQLELIEKEMDISECVTIGDLIDKLKEYYDNILSDIYDAIVSRGLIFPKENIDDYDDQIRKLKKVDLVIEFSEMLKNVSASEVVLVEKLTDRVGSQKFVPNYFSISDNLSSSNLTITVNDQIDITDILTVTVSHNES